MKNLIITFTCICVSTVIAILGTGSNSNFSGYIKEDDLTSLNLDGVDNLMIVAHPDDESLWGGFELLQNNYLVLCITNGNNYTRHKEFNNAMKFTNDIPLMLDYYDSQRYQWKTQRGQLVKDLESVLTLKDWKKIVTHSPLGESGHLQHRTLSKIVTNSCKNTGVFNSLYYFGKYYEENQLSVVAPTIDDQTYNLLMELYKSYPSQPRWMSKFEHMARYQSIVRACD